MRTGDLDGKGTVYDNSGNPILGREELVTRHLTNDTLYVSEGSSFWGTKALFDALSYKGQLFVTNRRLIFLRRPSLLLAARGHPYPYGIPDAIADAYKAEALNRRGAFEFCEIEFSEIEGFWVKKRTYGVLFLKSQSKGTRKAVMYQRGKADDKFVVLRQLLTPLLGVSAPEDKKGSFLLGRRYPFLGKRR